MRRWLKLQVVQSLLKDKTCGVRQHVSLAKVSSFRSALLRLCSRLSQLLPAINAWTRTAADYYDSAAAYEALARLSDAELARRGLSRTDLARHVTAVHADPLQEPKHDAEERGHRVVFQFEI